MVDSSDRVDRWHRNVARGSQLYADVSRRRLEAFSRQMETDVEKLLRLPKDALRRIVEDYLDQERKKGRSGDYIRTTMKAVRSWLAYNELELPKGLKVPNERSHPRVEREEPVTPDQLRKAILSANPGQRVVIALMAFSGVRPQVLGSYDGKDGLRIGDIQGLKIHGKSVEFGTVPALIRVRATSSKAGHAYFTFLGSEGCEYLKQHLEERLVAGQQLDKDTDVVSPSKAGKRFMTTINVGDRARQALRASGIEARPYAMRSYFFSRCLEAANAGKVSDRYVEFWSGHTGDVTARNYTTGRPNLPTSMVEDMRAAYKRCEPFLSTTPTKEVSTEDIQREAAVLLLTGLRGKTVAEARQMVEGKSGEDLAGLFKSDERNERTVPADEAQRFLDAGWSFVGSLKNGELAVVRSPALDVSRATLRVPDPQPPRTSGPGPY
jgi:integrase